MTMYQARITRKNPSAFIILIDQSGSMEEMTLFNNEKMPKAEAVSLVVNMMLSEIVNRCRKDSGYVDYFEIAVLGYRGSEVIPLLTSGTKMFTTPCKLAGTEKRKIRINKERMLPDGRSSISVIGQKVWVEPFAGGKTPMYEALLRCYDMVGQWCSDKKHRHGYPPAIFNITDGEASDGDYGRLLNISQRIKDIATTDGNILFFNIHISSNTNETPVVFPLSVSELPDEAYARLLYDMSSEMPPVYNDGIASLRGTQEAARYRGISYNAAMTDLISIMNIGSVTVNLLD